jgi:hypothetical protein
MGNGLQFFRAAKIGEWDRKRSGRKIQSSASGWQFAVHSLRIWITGYGLLNVSQGNIKIQGCVWGDAGACSGAAVSQS